MATRHYNRALRALPAAFLACRDRSLGHSWDVRPWRMDSSEPGVNTITREGRCETCGSTRKEFFSHGADGLLHKDRTVYGYADGYSLPVDPDLGPVRSASIWTEMVRRDGVEKAKQRVAKSALKA